VIEFKLSKEEYKKLDGVMREMADVTGVAMEKVLRNVCRDWCRAAIKDSVTPPAKAGKSPRWVKVKGKRNTYVPWKRKSAKGGIARQKKEGGLAKAGFSGCLTKLGVVPRIVKAPGLPWANQYIKKGERVVDKSHTGKQAREWSVVKGFRRGSGVSIQVGNICPFIEDYDKGKNPKNTPLHIGERAKQQVFKKMAKHLWKASEKVKEKWLTSKYWN